MFRIKDLVKAAAGKVNNGFTDSISGNISIDSRNITKADVFIAIKGDNFDGHDFIPEVLRKGASCIIKDERNRVVINNGVPVIEVKDSKKALGGIARFHRNSLNLPVIAITGSCGKTTTKDMLAWILAKDYKVLKNEGTKNNHIGVPLTLLKLDSSYDMAVLELGTNHFGEISYLAKISQPNVAIITNIGSAHLEYFKNLEGVFREKSSLLDNLEKPQIAVLNRDDVFLSRRIKKCSKNLFTISFGIKNKADFLAKDIRRSNSSIIFSVNNKSRVRINNSGYQNVYNALSAIAVARLFGIKYSDILNKLESFSFPPGRLNLIKFKNIDFIDDTYNANPSSLQLALDALRNLKAKGRKIFVMGDMLELGSQEEALHRQFGSIIAKTCDTFISVGELARISAISAEKAGLDTKNIFSCVSSNQARKILLDNLGLRKGDLVLVKGSRRMKMEEIIRSS